MLVDNIEVKTIFKFPNYAISKDGWIWSKSRTRSSGYKWPGRWLSPKLRNNGYLEVHLRKDKKHFYKLIHYLVLSTYKGERPNGKVSRHLDGNKLNNNVENLTWGTQSENAFDAVKHRTHPGLKRKGEKHPLAKLAERDVRMIIYMYRTGLFLQREIAEIYNITASCVGLISRKKRWKHIWKNPK